MKPTLPPSRRHAFTLIELLVVITIIAILAGASLPVFSKVLEKGKVTADAANLRQIGIAVATMQSDNDDFVFDGTTPSGGGGGGSSATPWALQLIDKYIDETQVFISKFDIRDPSGDINSEPVSYSLNGNVATEPDSGLWENTSSLIMIVNIPDSGNNGNNLVYSGTISTSPEITSATDTTPGTHSKGKRINILFADFHVESISLSELTSSTTNYNWDVN